MHSIINNDNRYFINQLNNVYKGFYIQSFGFSHFTVFIRMKRKRTIEDTFTCQYIHHDSLRRKVIAKYIFGM